MKPEKKKLVSDTTLDNKYVVLMTRQLMSQHRAHVVNEIAKRLTDRF